MTKWLVRFWIAIFLFSMFWILLYNFAPYSDPYRIELFATFFGFSLAISFPEILRIYDNRNREKELTKLLVQEVNEGVADIDSTVIIATVDIWEMAKSSGDLRLLDFEKLQLFTSYYSIIQIINELSPIRLQLIAAKNENEFNRVQEKLMPYYEDIKIKGKEIVTKYPSS